MVDMMSSVVSSRPQVRGDCFMLGWVRRMRPLTLPPLIKGGACHARCIKVRGNVDK